MMGCRLAAAAAAAMQRQRKSPPLSGVGCHGPNDAMPFFDPVALLRSGRSGGDPRLHHPRQVIGASMQFPAGESLRDVRRPGLYPGVWEI